MSKKKGLFEKINPFLDNVSKIWFIIVMEMLCVLAIFSLNRYPFTMSIAVVLKVVS